MDEKKIARINALAKKARTPEGLTPAERKNKTLCAQNTGSRWSATSKGS
mgnify:CR=1 FL=1